ncbi:hypothetical protein JAAARDRAFT_32236 [Jaapia argillacea MUCL 33604]|uniref:Uncharacterized protein n=1 Tax=Jaapia argillacea MUCL 33604 TaxID=933084 RepID=A0A067Q2M5_9AGAM|nr:hypothetical protein JAAARDRAFT_32236 [Jaapia argillacea MUCL 33604]
MTVKHIEKLLLHIQNRVTPPAFPHLVLSDEKHDDTFGEFCESLGIRYICIDPLHSQSHQNELDAANNQIIIRELVRSKPDLVLLLGWKHRLGGDFWRGVLIPRDVSNLTSFPCVVGIQGPAFLSGSDQDGEREFGELVASKIFPYQRVSFHSRRIMTDGERTPSNRDRKESSSSSSRIIGDFVVGVLGYMLERLGRYSEMRRLMDAKFYGDGPRGWNRKKPLAEMFLYRGEPNG